MIRKIYVTDKNNRDEITEYSVDEGGKTSWYPQRVSLGSFWKRYNFEDAEKIYDFDHIHREDKVSKSVYCESVWLFYKRIGYDHKKKKFTGEVEL